ncbi:MAG: hypothetical protein K9J12_18005 [Melioribacteraceae bacterium]|nr:hypothetical protein [Melioribacteraceae bacterium]MCF8264190.1 hypothetical protein [Melioribacteraceae bacterium]
MKRCICLITFILTSILSAQSKIDVPSVYSNLQLDENGKVFALMNGTKYYAKKDNSFYSIDKVLAEGRGMERGIELKFHESITGIVHYGFIHYSDSDHPMPVYRKDFIPIKQGRVFIDISSLNGKNDMINWEKNKQGTIGYRITNADGEIIYDGKISFIGNGPFEVVNTIIEGPFINLLAPNSCTINFNTNEKSIVELVVNGRIYTDQDSTYMHVFEINNLESSTYYKYVIKYGELKQSYAFKTAPIEGSREKFVFSYLSDSRHNGGGGERNLFGNNAYIMKKAAAVSSFYDSRFMQFTGDLINGAPTRLSESELQYINWKNVIAPFAHHFPIITGVGNHEKIVFDFGSDKNGEAIRIDRFPFETESAEVIYGQNFINPKNSPLSEDGAIYDPDPTKLDFPSYDENVFSYVYDNVAMIVLNSHYWYPDYKEIGGNPHGYIMDNQLNWLRQQITKFEKNPNIDHIFVTIHTPVFPNSGHIKDGMWHNGDNSVRPWIAGNQTKKGILERRDEILNITVNESQKFVAFLTGDEHNYCKTEIGPETPIYPEDYLYERIKLKRTVFQINNGSAGAPYQAQLEVPWTDFTTSFSTQYAICLFFIDGEKVEMKVLNPDTLEEIDFIKLR